MNDLPEHDEDGSGAARAFEDLREEMSVLRRAVEALPGAWTDNQPPDYSPNLVRDASQNLDRASQETERERRQLSGLIGTVREQRRQRGMLVFFPILAFVFVLGASPVFLGDLPFGLNPRAAAVTMGTDRWHAGWALMNAADPARWEKAAAAFSLVTDNQATLTACWLAANSGGKGQRCTIIVNPD